MTKMRGRLAKFISKFVYNSVTNAYDPELDDDRSQYPYDTASGFWAFGASAALTSMLLAQSGYWFKPETLVIENDGSVIQKAVVYDGNGSRQVFPILVAASDTVFIQKNQLRGIFFVSGVYISGNSNMIARIGGKLLVSIPNGQV